MATNVLCIAIVYMLLLLSPQYEATARKFPYSSPSTATEKEAQSGDYVKLMPRFNLRHGVLHGKELRDCMPKGIRHSSAPSRYVNYHTLGSSACLKVRHSKKP